MEPLPKKIQHSIILVYLFEEVIKEAKFMRFFNVDTKNEKEFIYDLVFGFMPRKFDASDEQDRIIYDEEEEVSEMFFI